MKKLLLCCLLLASCNSSSPSVTQPIPLTANGAPAQGTEQGTEQGNGADYYSDSDFQAWFLGQNKVIKYCWLVGSNFGVSESVISGTLQDVFGQWAQYIKDKQFNNGPFPETNLATQSLPLQSCDGSEDIKFYFGMTDADLTSTLNMPSGRVAAAVKATPLKSGDWHRGFVWVTAQGSINPENPRPNEVFPDWSREGNLHGILLHELGHVFGCQHVPWTVMDGEIANVLRNPYDSIRLPYVKNIDSFVELCSPDNENVELDGNFLPALSTQRSALFQELTNQKANGKISVHVHGNLVNGLILDLKDAIHISSFPMTLPQYQKEMIGPNYTVFTTPYTFQVESMYQINGSLSSKLGKQYAITLQRNIIFGNNQANPNFAVSPLVVTINYQGLTQYVVITNPKP